MTRSGTVLPCGAPAGVGADVDLVLHVHVHQLDAVRMLRARERRDFVLHVLAARLVAFENLDSIHRLALSGLELVALGNETFLP